MATLPSGGTVYYVGAIGSIGYVEEIGPPAEYGSHSGGGYVVSAPNAGDYGRAN